MELSFQIDPESGYDDEWPVNDAQIGCVSVARQYARGMTSTPRVHRSHYHVLPPQVSPVQSRNTQHTSHDQAQDTNRDACTTGQHDTKPALADHDSSYQSSCYE